MGLVLERAELTGRIRSAARSRDVRWALALAGLALALRLGFVLAYGRTQTLYLGSSAFGFNDTFFYSWTGAELAQGHGYTFLGHTTVHWPPGYSFLLAGVYRVFGADTAHALIANAVLGALSVPLAYAIGLRVAGRRAAVLAAAVLAVLPGQILMADVALAETLYTFELLAFIALVVTLRPRPRALVALGVVAGLAALTRGEGFFLPLIVLAFAWRRGGGRAALRQAAVVAAVMALTVAPWTIRNAFVAHSFVPVGTNASSTLWSGHNPNADGGPVYPPLGELTALGRMSEVDASAKERSEAIHWALSHPLRELVLIPLKLRALAKGDSTLISTWIDAAGQRPLGSPQKAVVGTLADVFSYGLIAALLLTAALLRRSLWRSPQMRAVLVLLVLAVPLYGFVYYGNVRYRVPLEPLMVLVVAAALAPAWERRVAARGAATAG